MSSQTLRKAPGFKAAIPWLILTVALILATEPVWSIPLLGFNPTLDALLSIRCTTITAHAG